MGNTPRTVTVVGAGMVGLSVARFLQQEGVQVTVVERDDVAAGSSWGNAGWLAPALTLPLPEPAILATGVRSALSPSSPVYVPPTVNPRLWKFLIGFARHCTPGKWRAAMEVFNQANAGALEAYSRLGVDPALIKPAEPFLAGFRSAEDRQTLVDEFDHVAHTGGATTYDLLDADAVQQVAPALGDAVTHGLSIHQQYFINPGRFVHALADLVQADGAKLVTGHAVTDIVERSGKPIVRCSDGSEIAADDVVIASGTWLGSLARQHGVRRVVQAGRGYSFTVYPEHVPDGPVYFPAQRVACTPLGEQADGLRVAGMMEFRSPSAPLDPRRIDAIVSAANPMLRGVDWSQRTGEWVGSRPCTTDGLPLVGRTKSPHVHVAGGHGMWGIALGPLTGQLLAEQLVHGRTSPVLQAFDPLR